MIQIIIISPHSKKITLMVFNFISLKIKLNISDTGN